MRSSSTASSQQRPITSPLFTQHRRSSTSFFSSQRTIVPRITSALPHFSDLPLDRAAHLRGQPAVLEELLDNPTSKCIVFYEKRLLVVSFCDLYDVENGSCIKVSTEQPTTFASSSRSSTTTTTTTAIDAFSPPFQTPDGEAPAWTLLTFHPREHSLASNLVEGYLFLGLTAAGEAVFACEVHEIPTEIDILEENMVYRGGEEEAKAMEAAPFLKSINEGGGVSYGVDKLLAWLVDVRSQGQRMTGADAAVAALAAGLYQWHANAKFCNRTGELTFLEAGGHARRASNTFCTLDDGTIIEKEKKPRAVYPRVDPAVIVGVTFAGSWALLGRKRTWDFGRYSLLAGFAEVGESLEGAVLREVFEESGVVVDVQSLRYHSSQAWPFPQSLMVGFVGEAIYPPSSSPSSSSSSSSSSPPPPPPPSSSSSPPPSSSSSSSSPFYNGGGGGSFSSSFGSSSRLPPQGFDRLPSTAAKSAAMDVGLREDEAEAYTFPPEVTVDVDEMEDVRWFHKDWMIKQLVPDDESDGFINKNRRFRIPGKYALANHIITDWLCGNAATPLREKEGGKVERQLLDFPDVTIDRKGIFKYILIRVSTTRKGGASKLVVRGDTRAAYHNHIFTACKTEAAKEGLSVEVLGGGRMEWDVKTRALNVFGYSAAFGPAPHEVTAAVIKKWNPFLKVNVSYEGY